MNCLIEELIVEQQDKLLSLARRIHPSITAEDILQPNDYPELELNPHFRYEEGILAGILTVQAALRAMKTPECSE